MNFVVHINYIKLVLTLGSDTDNFSIEVAMCKSVVIKCIRRDQKQRRGMAKLTKPCHSLVFVMEPEQLDI